MEGAGGGIGVQNYTVGDILRQANGDHCHTFGDILKYRSMYCWSYLFEEGHCSRLSTQVREGFEKRDQYTRVPCSCQGGVILLNYQIRI